jgi:formylglycine-generating enzyme required for sulfatase activity
MALGLCGCEPLLGLDKRFTLGDGGGGGGTAGSASVSSGSGGGCQGPCGTPGCGECPGGGMVTVAVPGGPGYRIDAVEVTNSAYAAFLASPPALDGQTPVCSFNHSFQPGVQSPLRGGQPHECPDVDFVSEVAGHPDWPVSCVDWCDALAYCQWAGKELCGGLSAGALSGVVTVGSAEPPTFDNPEGSAWYRACSNGGTQSYPYGASYAAGTCNDNSGPVTPVDVGATAECEGGYPGIFDMSGNIEELTAECWDTAVPGCMRRGGGFYHSDAGGDVYLACTSAYYNDRAFQSPTSGLRCCAAP